MPPSFQEKVWFEDEKKIFLPAIKTQNSALGAIRDAIGEQNGFLKKKLSKSNHSVRDKLAIAKEN